MGRPHLSHILRSQTLSTDVPSLVERFMKDASTSGIDSSLEIVSSYLEAGLLNQARSLMDKIIQIAFPSPPHMKIDGVTGRYSEHANSLSAIQPFFGKVAQMASESVAFAELVGPALCTLLIRWAQLDMEDRGVVVTDTFRKSRDHIDIDWPVNCSCTMCNEVWGFLVLTSDAGRLCAVLKIERLPPTTGSQHTVKHIEKALKAFVTSEIATWKVETNPDDDKLRDVWVSQDGSVRYGS